VKHRHALGIAALAPALAAMAIGPAAARADPGAGFPQPPPVDMRQLPTDTQPRALPRLRQVQGCAAPTAAGDGDLTSLTWGARSMKLSQLRTITKGTGARIAVIDTGVARHPLLAGRLVDGGDYVAGGTALSDCEGHGTAVAGIAAAAYDGDSGFAGLAPGAEVISIRQTSASYRTTGSDGTETPAGDVGTLAKAIVRAVALGADVINISETSCVAVADAASRGAAVQAAVHYAAQHNVVVVVAAGNRGNGGCPEQSGNSVIVLPAWYDEDVLAVASVAPDGTASQFGIRAPWVDVAAPGEQVASLSSSGSGLTDQIVVAPGQSVPLQGSSFAAPAVAGLAALIRSRYPQLSARHVVDRITATAKRADGAGRSDAVGWGTIDPVAALTRTPAVLEAPNQPDPSVLTGTGVLRLSGDDAHPTTDPAALWGGILALVAALGGGMLAVHRARGRNVADDASRRHDHP
jgi:membrane-anchored mycosin MYCP